MISGVGLISVQQADHHYGQRSKSGRTRGCENVCVTAKAPLRDLVERGSKALAHGGWLEARTYFEQALRCSDSAEAWDGLSWACWWLEDGTAAIQAREHAYRLYKDAGQRRSAALMAIWLANDHLDFRGEEAVAQGWLRRATRILDDLDPPLSMVGLLPWRRSSLWRRAS
jgi:hypothetical protein